MLEDELKEGQESDLSGGSPDKEDSGLTAEERIIQLEEELKQEREEKENYRKGLLDLKKKPREEVVVPKPEGDQNDDDEYDPKKIVQKELQKNKEEEYRANFKVATKKFYQSYPEYDPDNDSGDIRWAKVKERLEKMSPGFTVEEILESLEFIHRGITQPKIQPKPETEEKVEDSGVGNVPLSPAGKDKKPDAFTRPLNRYEQKAAEIYPGGEKAYREALAKREEKR